MSLVEYGAHVIHHAQDPTDHGVPAALLPRRRCSSCQLAKAHTEFPRLEGGVLGRAQRCIACAELPGHRLPRIYRIGGGNGFCFTESPSVTADEL
ncbi:hypothetical protein ACWEOW_13395 [Monashia sp. NPDC004114]